MRTQNDGKRWPKTKFEFAFSWTHQQYLGAACKLSWGALLLNYYMSQQCDCYVILCSIQAKQCWIPFPLLPHIYINLILCLSFKNIFHFYCRLMIVANFSLRLSQAVDQTQHWARDHYTIPTAVLSPTRLCDLRSVFLSKPTSKWWVLWNAYVVNIPFHRIFVCLYITIPFHLETNEHQSSFWLFYFTVNSSVAQKEIERK